MLRRGDSVTVGKASLRGELFAELPALRLRVCDVAPFLLVVGEAYRLVVGEASWLPVGLCRRKGLVEVELPVFWTETVPLAFVNDDAGANEEPGPVSSAGVGS